MGLTENEKLLIEAFRGALNSEEPIGLGTHKQELDRLNTQEGGAGYLHNQIDEMFHHKTADLDHHTGICAAFAKAHSYKYIDDPHFTTIMDREMAAQAIPKEQRSKACKIVSEIKEELRNEHHLWSERDAGWVDMNEIEEASFSEPNNGIEL